MAIPRTAYVLAGLFCAASAAASGTALKAGSFGAISEADLRKLNMSGCSFAVFRGKQNIVWFDITDKKKIAVFKIDGRLLRIPASASEDRTARWKGIVAGNTLRLIKGEVDPNIKLDEGVGGFGRMEWSGPAGRGAISVKWQEGC